MIDELRGNCIEVTGCLIIIKKKYLNGERKTDNKEKRQYFVEWNKANKGNLASIKK